MCNVGNGLVMSDLAEELQRLKKENLHWKRKYQRLERDLHSVSNLNDHASRLRAYNEREKHRQEMYMLIAKERTEKAEKANDTYFWQMSTLETLLLFMPVFPTAVMKKFTLLP